MNYCAVTCKVLRSYEYYERRRGVNRIKFSWINDIKTSIWLFVWHKSDKTEQWTEVYILLHEKNQTLHLDSTRRKSVLDESDQKGNITFSFNWFLGNLTTLIRFQILDIIQWEGSHGGIVLFDEKILLSCTLLLRYSTGRTEENKTKSLLGLRQVEFRPCYEYIMVIIMEEYLYTKLFNGPSLGFVIFERGE